MMGYDSWVGRLTRGRIEDLRRFAGRSGSFVRPGDGAARLTQGMGREGFVLQLDGAERVSSAFARRTFLVQPN